eukprot:364854-Chlamydomonas_euryale.AAC.2
MHPGIQVSGGCPLGKGGTCNWGTIECGTCNWGTIEGGMCNWGPIKGGTCNQGKAVRVTGDQSKAARCGGDRHAGKVWRRHEKWCGGDRLGVLWGIDGRLLGVADAETGQLLADCLCVDAERRPSFSMLLSDPMYGLTGAQADMRRSSLTGGNGGSGVAAGADRPTPLWRTLQALAAISDGSGGEEGRDQAGGSDGGGGEGVPSSVPEVRAQRRAVELLVAPSGSSLEAGVCGRTRGLLVFAGEKGGG